jgi:hypothetical protein
MSTSCRINQKKDRKLTTVFGQNTGISTRQAGVQNIYRAGRSAGIFTGQAGVQKYLPGGQECRNIYRAGRSAGIST